jgi:hypothetical protein
MITEDCHGPSGLAMTRTSNPRSSAFIRGLNSWFTPRDRQSRHLTGVKLKKQNQSRPLAGNPKY